MWDVYGVCPCGFHTHAPFAMKAHIHMEVCPDCGTPKSDWTVTTARWVSTAVWWNPLTWGSGHWEHKTA